MTTIVLVKEKWDHHKTANFQGVFSKKGLRLVTFHPAIEDVRAIMTSFKISAVSKARAVVAIGNFMPVRE